MMNELLGIVLMGSPFILIGIIIGGLSVYLLNTKKNRVNHTILVRELSKLLSEAYNQNDELKNRMVFEQNKKEKIIKEEA